MTGASRFLIGLVTCFATHDGIPAVARAARRRGAGQVEVAIVSWALSDAPGSVLRGAPAASTKALLRVLVEEVRVVSPQDIRPTYRVPVSVRRPNEVVGEAGFEPATCRV